MNTFPMPTFCKSIGKIIKEVISQMCNLFVWFVLGGSDGTSDSYNPATSMIFVITIKPRAL